MSGMLIPIVIIGFAVVMISLVAFIARRWTKCAPNEVLVVYGRKRKDKDGKEQGFRLIRGGATFVMPILEGIERVSLTSFPVEFSVTETPNIDGVLVSVDALANMKVSSDPALLCNAVECLLETPFPEVKKTATDTLSGILRQIVGTLKVEEIIKDREKISQQVLDAAVNELGKLGFELKNFVIQKITDKEGYIEALGKKRTAEVKRDATIAEAEAKRDGDVKSAAALQEGQVAQAKAALEISNAERERDETKAKNAAVVQAEQARIEVKAKTAAAEESRTFKVATVDAEMAETAARTRLQEKERERKDAELRATVVVTAEREKQAKIIEAEGQEQAATKLGEAARIKRAKEGEGEREYNVATAEGRKASADADKTEKEAAAAGERAKLLAEADGREAAGKAEGVAKLAVLSAEAKGLDQKNKALAQLSEGAKLIMVLEQLPDIIKHSGEAFEGALGAAFEHVGTGLSKIDSVHVIDMGNNSDGSNPVSNFALNIPRIVTQTIAQFKAVGVSPEKLFEVLGLDVSKLSSLLGGTFEAEAKADDDVAA